MRYRKTTRNMRKILYAVIIFIGMVGCSQKKDGATYYPSFKDDPTRKWVMQEAKAKAEAEKPMSMEERDRYLDSMTAEGEGSIIYGSDREYDTIIGHIRYIHVKAEKGDTPVDSAKHPERFNKRQRQ